MSRVVPANPTVMTVHESDFDPDKFDGFLKSFALRQHVRWWKSFLDPRYDTTSSNKELYIREEQIVPPSVYVVARGFEPARRLFPDGELRQGDIALTFQPDELPINTSDWIMLVGSDYDPVSTTTPIGRESYQNEVLTRGGSVTRLSGAVVSVGTTLTFTLPQTLKVGDTIKCVGQVRRIVSKTSSNVYVVNTAPSPVWGSTLCDKCYEELTIPFATYIDYIRTSSTTYVANVDFEVNLSGNSQVVWNVAGDAPSEGEKMSVGYYYTPVFMAQDSLGIRRHTVAGRSVLCTMMMRLVSQNDWKKSNLAK